VHKKKRSKHRATEKLKITPYIQTRWYFGDRGVMCDKY